MIQEACEFLRKNGLKKPQIFIVAGSGFRDSLPDVSAKIRIPMRSVPGLPAPSVVGHGADLIVGDFDHSSGKIPVLFATGRVHLYEGRSPGDVAFATRLAHALGCSHLVLTNAAGSVNPNLRPGSLMIISDHMNLTGRNCEFASIGSPACFTDMTNAYDRQWRDAVIASLAKSPPNAPIKQGIYAGLTGPSYETPAETRMLRLLGADAAGMSTVQECIAARTLGMKVFGVSLITNMTGGLGEIGENLDHADVLAVGKLAGNSIRQMIEKVITTAV